MFRCFGAFKGSEHAPDKPAFNAESYGVGFKAGHEAGFEAAVKAASNGGLFASNKAKPSGFTFFGHPSTTPTGAPSIGGLLCASSTSFGGNQQGKPASQVVHI